MRPFFDPLQCVGHRRGNAVGWPWLKERNALLREVSVEGVRIRRVAKWVAVLAVTLSFTANTDTGRPSPFADMKGRQRFA